MAEQLTGHMVPDADIEAILADPGGVCPGCVRIVIEGFRAEVGRLRAERARAVEALGSIGRTAVAATGDLEDGINAELIARERASGGIPDLREQFTAAIIDDLAQFHPDAAPDHDERQAARELAEVLAPIAESAVKRLRAERDAARVGMEKLRGLHRGVCVGVCGLDDACECEERDLACAECAASWPCATIRALDGTETAHPAVKQGAPA